MILRSIIVTVISIGILLSVWTAGSVLIGSSFIFPSPGEVFHELVQVSLQAKFFTNLGATCSRGLAAFMISFLLSCIIGVTSGLSDTIAIAVKPWMTVIKATPVVSIILIALLWFGSSLVPIFVSVLMTLPVMTEAITSGIRSTPPELLEMASIFRMKKRDILLHIRLPSSLPFLFAGAGASLGLTWKVVVAGEILGLPRNGIGTAMQTAKVHLETPQVFALTIAAIFLSILTDIVFHYLIVLTKQKYGTGEQKN